MSNKPNILDFQNMNVDKIEYTIPAPSLFDSQFSSMSYRLNKRKLIPIIIESPRLKTCSGIINVHGKYYMDLELQLSNVLCSQFHDFILSIDDRNILTCQINSIEWFSKQIEYETIEDYYKKKLIFIDQDIIPLCVWNYHLEMVLLPPKYMIH